MATFKLRSDANAVLENGTAGGNVLLNDVVANQVTQVRSEAALMCRCRPEA